MIVRYQRSFVRRWCVYALPLAICLGFLFPVPAKAHAVLLWSDPAKDAVMSGAPSQVRMRFSENVNPALSTAMVVNAADRRVDQNDAHVSASNSREMAVSLKPNLPSDVYVVVWRVQSSEDGHVLRGSFLFTVRAADGRVPSLKGTYPGQHVLGTDNTASGLYTGRMDGPALFNFIMFTLAEFGVIFWVGAQLWHTFVLRSLETDSTEQQALDHRAVQRFERFFSLPTLLIGFIANLGVLIGQGLVLTGGNFIEVLPLFGKLMTNGRFGTFWTAREIILLLALVFAAYPLWSRLHRPIMDEIIRWTNLMLGLVLMTAVVLSGHAAASNQTNLVYSVLIDWLHLLAASLWFGGMVYLSVVYLPALKGKSLVQRARFLLTTLPRFSPLAIAGVVIMALTGPFNATVRMSTLDQLVATVYGRALIVKVVGVGALLLTSAIHVRFFRPRLDKTFDAYQLALAKVASEAEDTESPEKAVHVISQKVKELEESVAGQTRRLIRVLRWEPVLGVAVLICTGLMTVFAGTLQPVTAQPNRQSTKPPNYQAKPFNVTTRTNDGQFTLELTVTPNLSGVNVFTVSVLDRDGKQDINVGVSLYLSMSMPMATHMDMPMGTETINLQSDGKGKFSSQGVLPAPGTWAARLEVRTPDSTLHKATAVVLFAPY